MQPITLKHHLDNGQNLEATFLPQKGMNLISFKRGDREIIAQSTKEQFEKGYNGLGPMIGPHFYQRNALTLPKIENESLFPHIAEIRKSNKWDPFKHGVARYAAWKTEVSGNKIKATLNGKDTLNGVSLSSLEGQDFTMNFQAELTSVGLKLDLSVVSQTDSLVGIHYYYNLPDGKGKIISKVKNQMIENNALKDIPENWMNDKILDMNLNEHVDVTLYPDPDPLHGEILLETSEYQLKTNYKCNCEENSWQLFHPRNAHFVCIEPVSSQDPRHPNLSASSLKIHLQIL